MNILNYITDYYQSLSYNRMFNWLIKHKEELPLPDEDKKILIERNRKFFAIDTSSFRRLKREWREKHNGK